MILTREDKMPEDIEKNIGVIQKFLEELPEKALNLGIRVLLACVFLFVGIQVVKLLRKIVKKSLSRANVDLGVIQFIDSAIKMSLYVVLGFMIASSFGVDAASILALLGSASVAIGLALQGSLSNFAGGILILLIKPFVSGDYIVACGEEGTVTSIDMCYTKLTTLDERIVVLPNGVLANSTIVNNTTTEVRTQMAKTYICNNTNVRSCNFCQTVHFTKIAYTHF